MIGLHTHHFPILVDNPPQLMLFAVDLHEDFIDIKGVTIAAVLSFQATGINGTKLDAPETDRLSAYGNTSLSQ